ncbi:hypothetical protein [Nonomuraea longicatena]|uniref:Uncharacterized protein n=1 Tax=Nonomuraea longicatena TaxID=83682 RepID=A0ABP3ZV15_9ACTN
MIGFDHRGTDRSNPIMCSLDLIAEMRNPLIADEAAFAHWQAFNERLREDCRKHTGPLLPDRPGGPAQGRALPGRADPRHRHPRHRRTPARLSRSPAPDVVARDARGRPSLATWRLE